MCLWLLTACLSMLPINPPQTSVVVVGVPTSIVQPTTAASGAPTAAPTDAPTLAPTAAPTDEPTVAPSLSTSTKPSTNPTPAPITTTDAPPSTAILTIATTTARITTGAPLISLVLCDNPDIVCLSNLDTNETGPLPIDPRLGTTPSELANLQMPNFDMAVKFPRQKRGTENITSVKDFMLSLRNNNEEHSRKKRQASCSCVPNGTCPTVTTVNNGAGLLDVRIVTPGHSQCPLGKTYCCLNNNAASIACGTLQTVPPTSVAPTTGQANFGEFPWQALILTKQNDYIAGGVLIDQLNVLTVTHRLTSYVVSGTAPNVKVRLGEWDAAGTYEPIPFKEYTVARVFSHPSYNAGSLQYDLTVLRLASPVPFRQAAGSIATINRVCLPPSSRSTYIGQRCWVSGWGKDMFGVQGQFQQILKEVDVTIVAPGTCQAQLQAARLGPGYVLDTTSFVCAGGEANKDSCTGDGGSGLVCQVNGQWVLVGLVSWGLGCATANVPGVYVNVAALLPWIQQQVATP